MHTQRQLSFQIVASGGHFVWIVKDNQANNLVIGLLNSQGFDNHAHARRIFDACPDKALALIGGL